MSETDEIIACAQTALGDICSAMDKLIDAGIDLQVANSRQALSPELLVVSKTLGSLCAESNLFGFLCPLERQLERVQ